MSKEPKKPSSKKRANKYEEKLSISGSLDDVLKASTKPDDKGKKK